MKIKEILKEENTTPFILDLGIITLFFICINILTTTTLQFLNVAINGFNVVFSAIVSIIFFMVLRDKKYSIKRNSICILSAFLIFVILTIFASNVYDLSEDGNTYHKTAIGSLKNGWNPLYEDNYEFNKENIPNILNEKYSLWVNHYPKATWNFAASIYYITGNIESGKVITFLTIFASLCISYAYFATKKMKKWQALVLSLVLSFNPLVLAQLFTYYVDGIMALYIYMLVLALLILYDDSIELISKTEKWLIVASIIILVMNIKFTGAFFACLFTIPFYVLDLIKNKKAEKFWKYFFVQTSIFALIVVIGILFVGASLYVKNTIFFKNPLYPLAGEGKVDIVTTMQPESFGSKSRFVKLFESLFAKTENITYASGDDPQLKIPFTIEDFELGNMGLPDTRIGGYGALYSAIFVLSLGVLVISMIFIFKKDKAVFTIICVLLIPIILTTVLLEEAWWARYSPQLWLLSEIAIFNLFFLFNNSNKKVGKYLSVIAFVLLFATIISNDYLYCKLRVDDIKVYRGISSEINVLKESDNQDISLNSPKVGILFDIEDANIDYTLVEKNDSQETFIYNWQIVY